MLKKNVGLIKLDWREGGSGITTLIHANQWCLIDRICGVSGLKEEEYAAWMGLEIVTAIKGHPSHLLVG